MTTLEDIFALRGKVALVTGACSGLGVEIGRALAIAGADVALTARRASCGRRSSSSPRHTRATSPAPSSTSPGGWAAW